MSQAPKDCIFCERPVSSKQNIFADWLKPYIPRTQVNFPAHFKVSDENGVVHSNTKIMGGDPHSKRLQVVCVKCNTGWMSVMEERAKPILIPLIEGRQANLTPHHQRTIAAWVAMNTIVAEYLNPTLAAVPKEDRTHVWLLRDAPKNWKIWIGRYKRENYPSLWGHVSGIIIDDSNIPKHHPRRPNTQSTMYVVGQLYCYAFSAASRVFFDRANLSGPVTGKIIKVWPAADHTISMPDAFLNDAEADAIARALDRFIKRADDARNVGHK